MASRPTIADLARASGVSVATVDRVLNGRLPVRPETVQRVAEAAREIGFHAAGLLQQRLETSGRELRLGFLLESPHQYFYQALGHGLEEAAGAHTGARIVPVLDHWRSQSPDEIVERLERLARKAQAVAMVSPEHPAVSAAVERLAGAGMPVFALLSDFAPNFRRAYVGVDNRKAGRTAGWLIARAARKPGKVAVFVGSHRFHGHELREIGLRSYLREHAPGFSVLDTLVNLETAELTREAMLALRDEHPDLAGCYIAGGGMEGAIAALREAGPGFRPAVIVPENTPESRSAMADGIVTAALATPIQRICAELIGTMARVAQGGEAGPGQIFLPFEVWLAENI